MVVNALSLGAMAFGGLVGVGLGIKYNIDADNNASIASNGQLQSGRPWLDATRAAYDAAYRDSTTAAVLYGAGAVLVVGSVIGYFVMRPAEN